MASEQWLLNDTSVANNAYFTAVGSSYKLRNVSGTTHNRRTTSPTPYEGSGYYASGLSNEALGRFYTSVSVQLTGGTYYVDTYFYLVSAPPSDVMAFAVTGDDTNVLYTWIQIGTDRSLSINSYDGVNGPAGWATTASNMVPTGEWFRLQYKTNASGVNEAKIFKGTNINGTTADATVSNNFATTYPFSVFGAWEYQAFCVDNTTNTTAVLYADDIKFDNSAYPTRSVAYTADASSTGTATGTATGARGQSIAGAPSITASGTAAMGVTRAIDASGTITATGVASMGVTQAMSATASITASGTAVADIRLLITADATSTVTATGSGSLISVGTFAGSATVTASATATLGKLQIIAGTSSVTANATADIQPISPGKLYGSLTKPTLTTRS
jgi:hypothetical protein